MVAARPRRERHDETVRRPILRVALGVVCVDGEAELVADEHSVLPARPLCVALGGRGLTSVDLELKRRAREVKSRDGDCDLEQASDGGHDRRLEATLAHRVDRHGATLATHDVNLNPTVGQALAGLGRRP